MEVGGEGDPHAIAGPSEMMSMGPPQLAVGSRIPKRKKAGQTAVPGPATSAPPTDTPQLSRKKRKEASSPPKPGEDVEYVVPRDQLVRELNRYSPEHLSSEAIHRSALRTLEALASFRVLPSRACDPGIPLSHISAETRSGVQSIREAISSLRNIAQGEGSDARVAHLEEQVRGLKEEVGRLRERLASITQVRHTEASQPAAWWSASVPPPKRKAPAKGPASSGAGRGGPGRPGRPGGPAPKEAREDAAPSRHPAEEFPPLEQEEGWREVRRRRQPAAAATEGSTRGIAPNAAPGPSARGGAPTRAKRRAVPRTAAVTITTTGERTYASIMKEAREKITLADYGLEHLVLKRARNGGLLFEFPGPAGQDQADNLSRALEEVLAGDAVVARPVKRAEIRVLGLDDSASRQEVVRAMRAVVGRPDADFQVGEIRRSATGLGALWVRCPLESAIKLADSKYLKVGWTRTRVQLLEDRPLQCFRCLAFGHLAASCKAQRDLKGRCFRCGGAGHVAGGCTAEVRCPLCEAEGGNPSHRMGGKACPAACRAAGRPPPPSGRKARGRGKRGGRTVVGVEGRRPAPSTVTGGRREALAPEPSTSRGRMEASSSEPPDVEMPNNLAVPSTSAAGDPPLHGREVLPPCSQMVEVEAAVPDTRYHRIPPEEEFDWEDPEFTPMEFSQSNH